MVARADGICRACGRAPRAWNELGDIGRPSGTCVTVGPTGNRKRTIAFSCRRPTAGGPC